MAAKGTEAKAEITKKILENFNGAFAYEKEIRIPYEENGETVQIKITLTCAKVNVPNPNEENLIEDESSEVSIKDVLPNFSEPSEEEKENLENLISKLNLF